MATTRKTTTQRGLGARHQQERRRLLADHVDGTPCGECKQPMFLDQELDADHTLARAHGGAKADRLLHASCNRSRGDGSRVAKAAVDRSRWTTLPWS